MNKSVLAIDLGASSGRGIVGTVIDNRLVLKEIHRFSNGPIRKNGHLVWDIDMLIREIKEAIQKSDNISSIGIDTWGVDYGLIDTNGNLINSPICYRDSRTSKVIDKCSEIMPLYKLYSLTGNQIMPINTLFQLISEENNLLQRKLLFMPDLLGYMLTGNMVMEKTIASTSQMMDLNNQCISDTISDKFSISQGIFPRVTECGTILGKYNGIDVVTVAGHDTQCAVSAVPTLKKDYAYISSGTWSLLGVNTDKPIVSEDSFEMGLSNEISYDGKYNYLKNITGLWIIQECKRNWVNYSYNEIVHMSDEADELKAFIDVDDQMFSVPCDMPKAIQEYCYNTKQYVPKTMGEIARCVYESLALEYRYSLSQIETVTHKVFSPVYIVGGGSKVQILNKFTSCALGRKVIAGVSEATAVGNIMIQLKAIGEVKNDCEAKNYIINSEELTEYNEQKSEKWENAYKLYENLKRRNRNDLS